MTKEQISKYNKEYNKHHPRNRRDYNKQYQKSDQYKLYHRNYALSVKGHYKHLKNSAKNRGLLVTISFSEFAKLNSLPCYYCGGELPKVGSGVDRIDSSLGYISGNVLPCCEWCNKAKGVRSVEEFFTWITLAHSRLSKLNLVNNFGV